MDSQDWTLAIAALEELEEILPNNVLAPLNLAVSHQQMGDEASALVAAQRALAVAPDNPRLLYAIASLHRDGGRTESWLETLSDYADLHADDPRPHHLASRWHSQDGNHEAARSHARQAVDIDPENLVLLVDLLVAAADIRDADEAADALDAVEDRLAGFDATLDIYAGELRTAALRGEGEALPPIARVIRNILRPGGLYRQHLIPLVGSGTVDNGIFFQLDFDPPLPASVQGGQDIAISLIETRATELTGIQAAGTMLASSHVERDALLIPTAEGATRVGWSEDGWRTESVEAIGPGHRVWSQLDVDQDGIGDLLVERDGELTLFSSITATRSHVVELESPLSALFPVDFDHDGDLDLVVSASSGTRYLRNGTDSWSTLNLLPPAVANATLTDLRSADFDDDGDLDLIAIADSTLRLLSNQRGGDLADLTETWELPDLPIHGVEVEDFDADGQFDVLAWSSGETVLLLNRGDRFEARTLAAVGGLDVAVAADFDNDGDRDLLGTSESTGIVLLRNRGGEFSSEPVDSRSRAAITQFLPGDYDGDGDLDVVSTSADGPAYWRNDGGSLNHSLRIRLRGKSENNSKNNSQGLFVRLESRTGSGYQAALGNGGVNHIGLGAYRQVDVLRVVWTNGLSQSWAALAAGQSLDEEQVLKGSCPFLYTWSGERFEFVTDLMWGSPLGMVLADGSAAPHQSAVDFVLVEGEKLQPVNGELWLQVTEELWEAIYLDHQQLLAVDHPESVELVVDETFTLPPRPTSPQLHWVDRRLHPSAARNHLGRDVLDELLEADDVHVGALPLTRFQGVTREHALEIDFDIERSGPARLVLEGWIFPTDTSINLALSQSDLSPPSPPRLEILRAGSWHPLPVAIGFPNGKNKAVVARIPHLPAGSVTLRLTTDMQIYWDSIALADPGTESEHVVTSLSPSRAELHYRGFSRLYRESESGPHLFDYADVSTAPRFRDLGGLYTRFGEVGDLVRAADDRYVVMNAGDELTLRYPVAALPPLPAGWRRDYVLFTDGWVKDGDINTVRSQSVEPLPYHGMKAYPDAGKHRFPDTAEHRRWRAEYQTRRVDDRAFRDIVRPPRTGGLP